ncbi:MAG: DUF3352 domain-containing protein [Elainella sp. C42_A2020_010]|nr:DUF3352 domain-containing protein [Elainella sp. C42_A2020_010]
MKPRSFFSVLAGVVLVLLLIGTAGAYWLTARSGAQVPKQIATQPTTAMFVSRQAAAMVTLLVNPERLESFWLAETSPANRRQLQAGLRQWQQSVFASSGLDYDRDLKTWLGDEVTFALTTPDVNRDAADGLQPGYLLVLVADDPELAQESLQSFWQRRANARDLVFEQFAGVQLIHAANKKTAAGQPSLTSAIVGGRYVLFANYPKVMREALNDVQVSDLNLEHSFTYQQALEKLTGPKLGLVYVNLAQFGNWLADSTIATASKIAATESGLEKPHYEAMAAALKPARQGLLADTLLLTTTPNAQPVRGAMTNASPILQFIPTNSRFAIASRDLPTTQTQWQSQIASIWADDSPNRAEHNQLQQPWLRLQPQWELQFPDDALDWVTGEYALIQLPANGRSQSDWVFVAQQTAETKTSIEQLDQVAQQQGISLGALSLDNQPISAWIKLKTEAAKPGLTSLRAEVAGVRTTIGDYELFATSLEALEQALAAQSATTSDIKDAIAQLQTPNQGYLYLNQEALEQLLRSIRGLELPKTLVSSLRSAVISSYGTDEAGLRGAIWLHLDGA